MKVLYQWAQRDPEDWHQIDAVDWDALPNRRIPATDEMGGGDNVLGWINDLCVQGVHFNGSDHVAVESVVIDGETGVRVTNWWDDPDDYPPGERRARVWTFLPLAADPDMGGAINTRQSQIVYAEGARLIDYTDSPPQNTTVLPWVDFVAPAAGLIRHQVLLTDAKYVEHVRARGSGDLEWGWRDWTEGLPDSEITVVQDGRRRLLDQREQGRYKPSEFTKTWFLRDTDLEVQTIAANNENAMLGTAGSGETESDTVDANEDASFAWVSPSDSTGPNTVDWPSGSYRAQFDCTVASDGLTYGNGTGAGFYRQIDGTGLQAFESMDESDFSGTGLKLGTHTWDPASNKATDQYAILLRVTGDSHGDTITMRYSSDAFADGPWPSVGGIVVLRRRREGA